MTIDAVVAAELAASPTLDHDVYVFCKTFDVAALLLARRIRAAGKIVAQDLFDDYFSQHDDPRLQRFRQWLADMAPVTHYAVCSTPRMVDVLRPYMPDIRITAIDDPIIGFDAERVAALAASKAERARATARIDVVWFGIGDNPYFPVGLHDLVACEPALASLERLGWDVSLRIVTNKRAVDQGGGGLLRQLSVAIRTGRMDRGGRSGGARTGDARHPAGQRPVVQPGQVDEPRGDRAGRGMPGAEHRLSAVPAGRRIHLPVDRAVHRRPGRGPAARAPGDDRRAAHATKRDRQPGGSGAKLRGGGAAGDGGGTAQAARAADRLPAPRAESRRSRCTRPSAH